MPTPAALTRLAELDPHLSLAQLVKYAGRSVRTLRGYVDGPPGEALPVDRIGGWIGFKRSEYDGGVRQFRSSRPPRR